MSQGLSFQRDSDVEMNITTYDVFFEGAPVFEDQFSIDFEIEIYDHHTVGNILRVKDLRAGEGANNYIFAYSYCDEQSSYFKFNIETKESRVADTLSNNQLGTGRWWPVSIRFNLKDDSAEVYLAGRRHVTTHLGLSSSMKPYIVFGSTKYAEKFAAFSIRNLRVGNESKRFQFPLNEREGGEVHDQQKKVVGRQQSGKWLINNSFHWTECARYRSQSVAAINFDTLHNTLLIVNRDSLLRYTPYNDHLATSPLPSPMPVHARLGTNHYDSQTGRMYIYEVNNLPEGDLTAAVLDVNTLQWQPISSDYLPTQRHHHVGIYDGVNGRYTIFGGFGNRRYSSDFVSFISANFPPPVSRWTTERFVGDTIYPRFATSLGRLNEQEALIYGGVGNETGDEIVGVVYYDDLYRVNFRQKRVERLWRRKSEGYDMVPVKNLFLSEDGNYFYALCYRIMEPHPYLKLYKISVADGSRVQLGDSIAGASTSILSNFNLYRSHDRDEMYCVLQEFVDMDRSDITVYSISTPVVASADLLYYDRRGKGLWVCALMVFAVLAGALVWAKRRAQLRTRVQIVDDEGPFPVVDTPHHTTRNALYVFGEFRVYNCNGRDISYMFSNIIRQLFVMMMVHSGRRGQGISSSALTEALWPDKDCHTVKNIKGVTIYNLRRILKEIDGVEIVYEDNRFRLQTGEAFYCDYYAYQLYWDSTKDAEASVETAAVLSNIVTRGRFLQGFDADYFDSLKSSFETEIASALPLQIAALYARQNYKQVMALASVLTFVDPYSEVALRYELHALLKLKQVEQAKKRFFQFKIAYLKSMGEEYPLGYNALVGESPETVLI